jgi:hypothetical protein
VRTPWSQSVIIYVVRMSLRSDIGHFSEYGLEPQPCQRTSRFLFARNGPFQLVAKYQLNRVIFHRATPQPARSMNITMHRAARAFPFRVN